MEENSGVSAKSLSRNLNRFTVPFLMKALALPTGTLDLTGRSRWNAAPTKKQYKAHFSTVPSTWHLSLRPIAEMYLFNFNLRISPFLPVARWGNCELSAFQHLTKVFLGMTRKSKLRDTVSIHYFNPLRDIVSITLIPLNFIILELNNQISTHLNHIFSTPWRDFLKLRFSSSLLSWKSHGQRSLAGYKSIGSQESDTT